MSDVNSSTMKIPRVGLGYDLHTLVEGRPFVIGGVLIPFDKGPLGHSDGDALCHAIADALLGAAGMGDIGMWFPPGDPEFKNADSTLLLKKIVHALKEKGHSIVNVDSVVLCERPKLSPHYPKMREVLASALEISSDCVSVKATTNEGVGAIGEGTAVAAKAIALIL